jgi:hypothetical protein
MDLAEYGVKEECRKCHLRCPVGKMTRRFIAIDRDWVLPSLGKIRERMMIGVWDSISLLHRFRKKANQTKSTSQPFVKTANSPPSIRPKGVSSSAEGPVGTRPGLRWLREVREFG